MECAAGKRGRARGPLAAEATAKGKTGRQVGGAAGAGQELSLGFGDGARNAAQREISLSCEAAPGSSVSGQAARSWRSQVFFSVFIFQKHQEQGLSELQIEPWGWG